MRDKNYSQFKIVKDFIKHNFRHFNAAVVADASEVYVQHLKMVEKYSWLLPER